MIRRKMNTLTAIAVAATFSVFWAEQSEAATISCVAPVSGDVSSYDGGCEYFDPILSGTLKLADMNDNAALGYNAWVNIGKLDSTSTEGDVSVLTTAFSPAGGSYNIAASWFDDYDIIALGFKDGRSTPSNAIVYGFLTAVSGTYESMFYNSGSCDGKIPGDCDDDDRQGGTGGAISNITIWGVKEGCDPVTQLCGPGSGPPPIPVPAALPLLLTALGATAVLARRKKKKAA